MTAYTQRKKSLVDIMAKCCVVFPQLAFGGPTAFRVRYVLLLVSILTISAPDQWIVWDSLGKCRPPVLPRMRDGVLFDKDVIKISLLINPLML